LVLGPLFLLAGHTFFLLVAAMAEEREGRKESFEAAKKMQQILSHGSRRRKEKIHSWDGILPLLLLLTVYHHHSHHHHHHHHCLKLKLFIFIIVRNSQLPLFDSCFSHQHLTPKYPLVIVFQLDL
jgi:hypothetical protein